MAVKISYLSKTNYTVYNGVYSGQTLYVIFDNDKLFARYGFEAEPETINVLTSNSFVWEINPLLTMQSVNQLMDDILPYIQQLADHVGVGWNGYQWVGKFDDDDVVQEIMDAIEEFIEVDNEELPHYDVVSPEYYNVIFSNKTPAEMRSYVSSKSYLTDNILFVEDPYKFVNFAIGSNASVANDYTIVLYNIFMEYMENVSEIDEAELNNNNHHNTIVRMYDNAISYYYDVIGEPDKTKYIDMLLYGNTYLNTIIRILEEDDMLTFDSVLEMCEEYIVDIPDLAVTVDSDEELGGEFEVEENQQPMDDENGMEELPETLEFDDTGEQENLPQSQDSTVVQQQDIDISDNYEVPQQPIVNAVPVSEMVITKDQLDMVETSDISDDFWTKSSGAKAI